MTLQARIESDQITSMASPYQSSMSFSPSVSGTADMTATGAAAGASTAAGAGSSRPISDLPQSQVDAIIRTKRKAREPKACYPCHARKVKCDRNLPCDGCVKRDHADLCSYERPSKKRIMTGSVPPQAATNYSDSPVGAATPGGVPEQIGIPAQPEAGVRLKQEPGTTRSVPSVPLGPSGRVSVAREEWDNVRTRLKEMEQTISNLRVGLERAEEGQASSLETGSVQSGDASNRSKAASPEREGIHAANTLGEGTVHLGSRSVLAYILNNKSGSDQLQALLEGGILPKLGLDNESATYPFVDLWSSDMSTFDISAVCSALPVDQQCKELVLRFPIGRDLLRVEADVAQVLLLLPRHRRRHISRDRRHGTL